MNERARRRANRGDSEGEAPAGNRQRNPAKTGNQRAEAHAELSATAAASPPMVTRKLKIIVRPKENRLVSLFVYELTPEGRRVDPSGGVFIHFDDNNEGSFDAGVGLRYEFDWYLVGDDDKAVSIEFSYPDGTPAAKVPESKTKIRSGRRRSFGVKDLPREGVIQ